MLSHGQFDNLPVANSIIPFTSLYSIVVLKPSNEDRYWIPISSQPNLSILCTNGFVPAPPETSPGDPGVAHIFDVLGLPSSPIPVACGQVPLSPTNPEFTHRHLWRLPLSFPVILTTFLCTLDVLTSDIEEIRLALGIHWILEASKLGLVVNHSNSGIITVFIWSIQWWQICPWPRFKAERRWQCWLW